MPLGYQVVFRAEDDRILAPDVARRRAWSRALLDHGRPHGLFGFGLGDTHGHAVLACERPAVSRFIHDLRLSLRSRLDLRLVDPSVRPIDDTWHAEKALGYVHRQDVHHRVGADPFREGTSLPDLLGLRPPGLWLADRVRALLPRVKRVDLLAHWGIDALDPAFCLGQLADAGAAAIAVSRLMGRGIDVVEARRACVAAAPSDVSTADLAAALGVATRTIRDCRGAPVDAGLVRAVRLQMGLRTVVVSAEEGSFVRDASPVACALALG